MERFDLVATERRALADLLEGLTPAQWATQSLCGAWDVKQVAAHTMVGPTSSMKEITTAMLRGRGSFHRANRIMVDNRAKMSTDEVVAVLRDRATSRFTPPMHDWRAPLSDIMIHREDIAVPLGLPQDRPLDSWRLVLDFLVTPKARSAFTGREIPALRYVATDQDWSHGDGPEVAGTSTALALTLLSRTALADGLTGDGADALRAWAS